MSKKTRQNWANRRFVWLREVSVKDSYAHEHDMCYSYFNGYSFTYYECKNLIAKIIQLRPNYLNRNVNYSNLEAGHRFKTLYNLGTIVEIKV